MLVGTRQIPLQYARTPCKYQCFGRLSQMLRRDVFTRRHPACFTILYIYIIICFEMFCLETRLFLCNQKQCLFPCFSFGWVRKPWRRLFDQLFVNRNIHSFQPKRQFDTDAFPMTSRNPEWMLAFVCVNICLQTKRGQIAVIARLDTRSESIGSFYIFLDSFVIALWWFESTASTWSFSLVAEVCSNGPACPKAWQWGLSPANSQDFYHGGLERESTTCVGLLSLTTTTRSTRVCCFHTSIIHSDWPGL